MTKKKLTLSIVNDLNQRLDFEAAITGKDRSSIVSELIENHIALPTDWSDLDTLCPTDAKSSPRQQTEDAKRSKTTFYISAKASMSLSVQAGLTGTDRSDVVETLIRDHIAPWKTYDERKHHLRALPTNRRKHSVQITSSDSVAA
jgi:metal-responsive CopG/Arc/MetJ family transcriptional regulator